MSHGGSCVTQTLAGNEERLLGDEEVVFFLQPRPVCALRVKLGFASQDSVGDARINQHGAPGEGRRNKAHGAGGRSAETRRSNPGRPARVRPRFGLCGDRFLDVLNQLLVACVADVLDDLVNRQPQRLRQLGNVPRARGGDSKLPKADPLAGTYAHLVGYLLE